MPQRIVLSTPLQCVRQSLGDTSRKDGTKTHPPQGNQKRAQRRGHDHGDSNPSSTSTQLSILKVATRKEREQRANQTGYEGPDFTRRSLTQVCTNYNNRTHQPGTSPWTHRPGARYERPVNRRQGYEREEEPTVDDNKGGSDPQKMRRAYRIGWKARHVASRRGNMCQKNERTR